MSPESAWPAEPASSRTDWLERQMVGGDDREQNQEHVEAEYATCVRSVNSARRIVADYAEQSQSRHNGEDDSAGHRELER